MDANEKEPICETCDMIAPHHTVLAFTKPLRRILSLRIITPIAKVEMLPPMPREIVNTDLT